MTVTLLHGDCLEILPTLTEQFDAIITDLPYGTTACKWDEIIPFEPMWEQVKRLLKPRGVFVTTASQPFTSKLVMSNLEWFKYEWVWKKNRPTNFLLSKYMPGKIHENILVFSPTGNSTYNPIYEPLENSSKKRRLRKDLTDTKVHGTENVLKKLSTNYGKTIKNPVSVINFNLDQNNQYVKRCFHPTQKPVALYEYLIRTYTNAGDTMLDFCAGSGTTGVAAINTGRNAILIEKDADYFTIMERRIAEAQQQPILIGA